MKPIPLTKTYSISIKTILFLIVLLALAGTLVFSFYEMKSLRRDLYAVRDDYYNINAEENNEKVDYEVISQEVKSLRVPDYESYNDKSYEGYDYKKQDIRVLEVKVKNNLSYLYMYYDSLAAVGENGVLQRSVAVHPDDNQNDWYQNYGSLELVPGGEATVYVYLLDTGSEITKLYDTENSTAIDLY